MLRWELFFLIYVLAAAVLGFSGMGGSAAKFAQIYFYLGLFLLLAPLVFVIVKKVRPWFHGLHFKHFPGLHLKH